MKPCLINFLMNLIFHTFARSHTFAFTLLTYTYNRIHCYHKIFQFSSFNTNEIFSIIIMTGLSSFYSLVLLSTIRYKTEVEFETKWTSITHESFFSKRHILVAGTAFIIAVPPTFGIGQYDDSGVL